MMSPVLIHSDQHKLFFPAAPELKEAHEEETEQAGIAGMSSDIGVAL
jgi:hypothetical protein